MTLNDRRMLLAAFVLVPTAHHQGAWRYPLARTDYLSLDFWTDLAKRIEDASFDLLFLPDILSIYSVEGSGYDNTLRYGGQSSIGADPLLILAAVAGSTKRIGLGATLSATFFPPFSLARSLSTLDHLSNGRAAWNVVMSTQANEAHNFGMPDIPSRQDRYDRGDEYLELCCRLWDSWDAEALLVDKESGIFADPAKVRQVPDGGRSVTSPGPLTLPRSPQGRPVILQAGSSPRGRDFAARWGEVVFCLQRNLPEMQAFRRDIRARAESFGRDPDDIRVIPGLQVIVGETESMAQERAEMMNALVDSRAAIATLSAHVGIDLSSFPLDEPVKNIELSDQSQQGSFDVLMAVSGEGMSLEQAARRFATTELTPQVVGSPSQVADELEHYFVNEGCDGFTLTSTYLPGSYEDFGRLVVPELRKRGLVPQEPSTSPTLRAALGTKAAPLPS